MTQQGLSCTLEQLGLGVEEPQGGPCSEPSAPSPVLLLAAWANDLLGNQQTSWKPWPGTTLLFLPSQVGETALFHPLTVTVLLCSSWHSRTG